MTQRGFSVAAFVLLAGCGGTGLNAPVEITVAFQSGATTPTTVKADTPTAFNGTLCAPSSLQFVGQNWPASSDAPGFHMYANDNCSDVSNPPLYACTPAGAPAAQDGIQGCATATLQTPASALGAGFNLQNGGSLDGPFTNTAGVTSLVFFYCASGDTLVGPPAASEVSCKQL
jgi:hypothetical protein